MKELLKNQDESCLILHDFDRNHVLTALENLIKKSDSSDGEDIYNILKFDKEIVPSNVKLDVSSSTKKLFKCNVKNCSTVFQRLRHFQRHVSSHTKNSQYVCEQCGKVFYHEDNLKLHMRYHQDILDIHTCPHCQYDFHGRRALQCHIDDQHTPLVSCPICKKSLKKRMLLRHVRSKHANDANKKENLKKTLELLNGKQDIPNNKVSKKKSPEALVTVLDTNAVEDLIQNQQKRVKCNN